MSYPNAGWHREPDPDARRAADLHVLRVLAWLVKQDRYRAEPACVERLRKTRVTIRSYTWHVEAPDWTEGEAAVREIEERRDWRRG
jgi:hypothetical protein